MIKRGAIVVSMLLALSAAVFAVSQQVIFNGPWENATTVYSSGYEVINGSMYAKDAYPDRGAVNCTNITEEKRTRVCIEFQYDEIQTCYRLQNATVYCTSDIKSRIITKNVCEYKTINVTKEKCTRTYVQGALCYNSNGVKTNSLLLSNYNYSTNNVTWITIPYGNTSIFNQTLYFKLDIPAMCKPQYKINEAIVVQNDTNATMI